MIGLRAQWLLHRKRFSVKARVEPCACHSPTVLQLFPFLKNTVFTSKARHAFPMVSFSAWEVRETTNSASCLFDLWAHHQARCVQSESENKRLKPESPSWWQQEWAISYLICNASMCKALVGSAFQSSAHGGVQLLQQLLLHGFPCASGQHLPLLPPGEMALSTAWIKP